jgi:hypothetical protein
MIKREEDTMVTTPLSSAVPGSFAVKATRTLRFLFASLIATCLPAWLAV